MKKELKSKRFKIEVLAIPNTCKSKLSQKIIQEIEEARGRVKKGEFYTEKEVKKILYI